jgi:hypothetical protein
MHRKRNVVAGVLLFVVAVGLACYFIPQADDLKIYSAARDAALAGPIRMNGAQ